jgi:hypothetical protein
MGTAISMARLGSDLMSESIHSRRLEAASSPSAIAAWRSASVTALRNSPSQVSNCAPGVFAGLDSNAGVCAVMDVPTGVGAFCSEVVVLARGGGMAAGGGRWIVTKRISRAETKAAPATKRIVRRIILTRSRRRTKIPGGVHTTGLANS